MSLRSNATSKVTLAGFASAAAGALSDPVVARNEHTLNIDPTASPS